MNGGHERVAIRYHAQRLFLPDPQSGNLTLT